MILCSSQLAAPEYGHSRLLFQSRLPITSKKFETPVPSIKSRGIPFSWLLSTWKKKWKENGRKIEPKRNP